MLSQIIMTLILLAHWPCTSAYLTMCSKGLSSGSSLSRRPFKRACIEDLKYLLHDSFMANGHKCWTVSRKVEPTDTCKPDDACAWQSCARVPICTGTLQNEEQFDLNAISSSEDKLDEHDVNPMISTAQEGSSRHPINDPDAVPLLKKTTARDVLYFFEKTDDKSVCKICRQVLLRFQLFRFWIENIILREAQEADLSSWPNVTPMCMHHSYSDSLQA